MRRIGAVCGVVALAALLGGCWVQPGYDPGRSYWNSADSTITAANAGDLVPVWETATAGHPAATYGGAVFVQDRLTTSALDAATGQVRWSTDVQTPTGFPADQFSSGAPIVAGGTVQVPWRYVLRGGRVSLDPATGAVVDVTGGGPALGDAAVVDDSPVVGVNQLVSTGGNFRAQVQGLPFVPTFLYSATTGGGSPGTEFAVVGGRVAWSFGTEATGFSAACPSYPVPVDGCAPDWRTDLGAVPVAVASLGSDRAAYVDEQGRVSAVDLATGEVVWTVELGAPARPVVVGSTLVLRAGDRVAAFPAGGCGAPTCEPAWTAAEGDTTPVLAAGELVYATGGGDILAFAADGCGEAACAPLVRLSVEGTGVAPFLVDGGQLYAATEDGRIIAFAVSPSRPERP